MTTKHTTNLALILIRPFLEPPRLPRCCDCQGTLKVRLVYPEPRWPMGAEFQDLGDGTHEARGDRYMDRPPK